MERMMDRISGIDESALDALRTAYLANATAEDETLEPNARRLRPEIFEGSHLKAGDDVEIDHSWTVRIVSAGRGERVVSVYKPEWFGELLIDLDLWDPPAILSDRAPLDPEEQGMPIFPEEVAQALRAAQNPKRAASEEAVRRSNRHELIHAQTPSTARILREAFKQHGLLDKD